MTSVTGKARKVGGQVVGRASEQGAGHRPAPVPRWGKAGTRLERGGTSRWPGRRGSCGRGAPAAIAARPPMPTMVTARSHSPAADGAGPRSVPDGEGPPEKRLAAATGAVGQPLGRAACERGGGGTIAWVGPRTTQGRGPTRQRMRRELRLAGEGRQWQLQHGEGWQLEVRRCEGGDDRGCAGGREGEGRRPPATAGGHDGLPCWRRQVSRAGTCFLVGD